MHTCSVKGCKNAKSGVTACSYFNFPSDPNIAKKWIKFCRQEKDFKPKHARICMEHFTTNDYENKMQLEMGFACNRKLKRGAIPSVYEVPDDGQFSKRTARIQKRDRRKVVEELLHEPDANVSVPSDEEYEGNEIPERCPTPLDEYVEMEANDPTENNSTQYLHEEIRRLERKLCRTCLCENVTELFDWNSSIEENGEVYNEINYMKCYQECTQIDIDDFLPQTICYQCAEQLRDAYFFIKRAKESHQELLRTEELYLDSEEPDQYQHSEADFEWVGVQKCDNALPAIILETENKDVSDNHHERTNSDCDGIECDSTMPLKFDAEIVDEHLVKEECDNTEVFEILTELEAYSDTSAQFGDESELHNGVNGDTARKRKQRLLCHACPCTFKDVKSLQNHSATHVENRPRNHPCDQCDRKFFTRSCFLEHRKIHDKNRKQYKCEQCEKLFFNKGSLNVHVKHHIGGNLECSVCSKKYVRAFDLTVHMRTHSGDMPFKCTYCDRSFSRSGTLNQHMRKHEGYRYKCDICAQDFELYSTLRNHRKFHTGLPYKCIICKKGFVEKSKIKRHISGVHKKRTEEIDDFVGKVKTIQRFRARDLSSRFK